VILFKSAEWVYREQREPIPILKTLNGRTYFSQKVTQLSAGDNVIDAPPSYPHGLLSRDTCISSTELKKPIWQKGSLSPPRKTFFTLSIHFKNKIISQRATVCLNILLLKYMVFFLVIYVFLQIS
jgi:hypothetical protein